VQSLTLAILAAAIAAFTSSVELAGVAVALALLKVVIIPRVLTRAVVRRCGHAAIGPIRGTGPAVRARAGAARMVLLFSRGAAARGS